ncbi:hypothetical protein B0H34DRAFT_727629 [Crassisporium funariophilum]|nr:hypothetical protein B0H34DRAFT_727629 [Crassisporium funariophilum]
MGGGVSANKDTKTVVVLGAAYGGARAAQILAAGVPEGWKVILIDRNSHANHVYVMPRYAVLPGHEYKAFIPYTNVFLVDPPKSKHTYLHAHITALRPNHITLSQASPEFEIPSQTIAFDYAVYALGSHLPPPLDLWGSSAKAHSAKEETKGNSSYHGLKVEGCEWFKQKQKVIEAAPTILVVGGGALGIQFATDIKAVYPAKQVTLLHSRDRLLPRFNQKMHSEIMSTCVDMDIEVILGERLDLDSIEDGKAKVNPLGQKVVRTNKGREIAADLLLLCTGQVPNSGLLKAMDPSTVNETNKLARVLKTLQLCNFVVSDDDASAITSALESLAETAKEIPEKPKSCTPYPHIFAIGDVADAFGAIPAGHNAYSQAEVAARNILRLIERQESAGLKAGEESEPLESYKRGPDAIKVSLGLTKSVYQVGSSIGVKNEGQPDLQASAIWPYFGIKVDKDEDMYP